MMEAARRDTRILLVEDNPTTLKTFARLVEKIEGCVPVCYDDPADLVASLPDIDFDIAVLDYRLPFCTGLDLIRKLRVSPRHQDILIVLVTADDEPAIRQSHRIEPPSVDTSGFIHSHLPVSLALFMRQCLFY